MNVILFTKHKLHKYKFTDESLDKCYVVSNNVTRCKIRKLVYVISHKYKQ